MRTLASLGSFTVVVSLTLCAASVGCRSGGTGGTGGAGASGGAGGSGGSEGGAGGSEGGAGGSTGGAGGSGGSAFVCEGVGATIPEITQGAIGPGVDVNLTGAVAMSQKFLVSKSSNTGSCLWGVFLSAPGLATTAEYSGVLALSYGNQATTGSDGKSYCAKLGQEPTGGAIPDDIAPGDVVDVVGETSSFILQQCASEPGGASVPQKQLAKVCSMTKTGTAPVPTPATLTDADAAKLAAGSDAAFLDKWSGVKVRFADAASVPRPEDPNNPASMPVTVDKFGVYELDNGAEVTSKLYYRGYSNSKCHESPVYSDAGVTFTRTDGFVLLDYCTYRLAANDKCADADPASGDCQGAATCPPDTL